MMRFAFAFFSCFAWFVTKMPDSVLYGLSGIARIVLSKVVGYRKDVIRNNLKKSFPEFSENEINRTMREFYKHFADIFVEVIKTPGLTADQIKERFSFVNSEVIRDVSKMKRSVIILTGHLGNWEWLGPGLVYKFPDLECFAVVKPLSNPYFEKYMSDLRCLHQKDSLIPFKQTLRYMINNNKRHTLTLFAADQTPHRSEINFNTRFLNQTTPFFTGFEKIAKMLNQPVVFLDLYRTRRGHYQVEFHLITDKPAETPDLYITNEYTRLLEQTIRKRPYNWLWSHRRWKYAPKEDEKAINAII